MNGITDPSLSQAKLSLAMDLKKIAHNFDVMMDYLTNHVSH